MSTDPLPIKLGQGFTLSDWAHQSVADDPFAPATGFVFRNTPSATAVLYGIVNGKNAPVYMAPEGVLPPRATDILTPQISVAVWFQRDVETGYMFDQASVNPFIVPMTTPNMTIHYTEAGEWVVTSEPLDYTRGKFAKNRILAKEAIDSQEPLNGFPQEVWTMVLPDCLETARDFIPLECRVAPQY